ncbi:MAG: efflux RND transporter periplasmic adaptor subunit [Archangiaceae bacterium]|nr:efflux RND transporter periplasmic adaptor subunit [Archangiaceae bacterium]
MKKHTLTFSVALAVALVALAALAAGADDLKTPQSPVKLVKARPVTSSAREQLTGQLFPSKLLPLGFEVGGRLVKTYANKGDTVKAGMTVAQLDTEIIDAQVAQAEAGVAASEAAATLATDMAQKNEKLRAEGSVSDAQAKTVLTQGKQAEAGLAAAKAQLAQARAGRKRHDLKTTISGTVIDAPDNTGGLIGPGMPVFIIQQIDTLTLKTTIAESTRAMVKAGLKVHVESVGSGASTDDATVKVIIPTADPSTRRIPIEVSVPNQDGRFVSMTLAKATLPLGEAKKAFAIPATALGTTGGEHVLVQAGGALKRVGVTVLERNPKEVVVVPDEALDQIVDYPQAASNQTQTSTKP